MLGQRQQSSVDPCELSVFERTARFPCAADRRHWEPLPTGEIISARNITTQTLVDKQTEFVLDSLTDWKPVQLITQIVCNVIELPLSQNQARRDQRPAYSSRLLT